MCTYGNSYFTTKVCVRGNSYYSDGNTMCTENGRTGVRFFVFMFVYALMDNNSPLKNFIKRKSSNLCSCKYVRYSSYAIWLCLP